MTLLPHRMMGRVDTHFLPLPTVDHWLVMRLIHPYTYILEPKRVVEDIGLCEIHRFLLATPSDRTTKSGQLYKLKDSRKMAPNEADTHKVTLAITPRPLDPRLSTSPSRSKDRRSSGRPCILEDEQLCPELTNRMPEKSSDPHGTK